MPALDRIAVYPIKSLDPAYPEQVTVRPDGGLAHDRRYAIVDDEGAYVNGKRTPAVHRIRAEHDLAAERVRLRDGVAATAENVAIEGTLTDDDDRSRIATWLAERVPDVHAIRPADGPNLTDSSAGAGPSVIGDGTLRTVASWFEDLEVPDVRRRLRPNLVVSNVPPFWEDRLVADPSHPGTVSIGGVRLSGSKPVPRCVVPTRDPETGQPAADFRRTFLERRRETLPAWADPDAYEHLYSLMVVTRVLDADRGATLSVSDAVVDPASS